MNKKLTKILNVLIIAIICISIATNVFAITPGEITGNTSVTGSTEITSLGTSVVGILQTVGVILSVVVLIIIGIKYMLGSAEEKADYKKSMIPYIVGAALIFTASICANILFQFFTGISST